MRFRPLQPPLPVVSCPRCQQGDEFVVGGEWPDPTFDVAGGRVAQGVPGLPVVMSGEVPELVNYVLRDGCRVPREEYELHVRVIGIGIGINRLGSWKPTKETR